MLALIQRVNHASVTIDNNIHGQIGPGILLLLGVQRGDDRAAADKLLNKVLAYRIFNDSDAKMNLSLTQTGGGLLIISQFTLAADTRKGLRPGFSSAAPPTQGEALYDYFVEQARSTGIQIATGQFGADMQVALVNDGPVTFMLES